MPSELKGQHKTIPWRPVAGLDNVLCHDYPGSKTNASWIVTNDPRTPESCGRDDLHDLERRGTE
jgi:uncharacterized protein with HEPN domain